jgi:hypothetical protein
MGDKQAERKPEGAKEGHSEEGSLAQRVQGGL